MIAEFGRKFASIAERARSECAEPANRRKQIIPTFVDPFNLSNMKMSACSGKSLTRLVPAFVRFFFLKWGDIQRSCVLYSVVDDISNTSHFHVISFFLQVCHD